MRFNTGFLKLFYRALITGLPLTTYNSFSGVSFHSPAKVLLGSTYVNYKLTENEFNYINNHLFKTTDNLKLKQICISQDKKNEDYYVSINIYNCTSPMFSIVSDSAVTRCEINTYITNKKNEYGTLIMDYCSNFLSIDPDNIFRLPTFTSYLSNKQYPLGDRNEILKAKGKNIDFFINYTASPRDKDFKISDQLIYFTDKIFYNNGLYDKLYYDTSLILAKTKIPVVHNLSFKFFDLEFSQPESIFYFTNELNFVCAMWNNLDNFSWL